MREDSFNSRYFNNIQVGEEGDDKEETKFRQNK